jgi:hypothetical protein
LKSIRRYKFETAASQDRGGDPADFYDPHKHGFDVDVEKAPGLAEVFNKGVVCYARIDENALEEYREQDVLVVPMISDAELPGSLQELHLLPEKTIYRDQNISLGFYGVVILPDGQRSKQCAETYVQNVLSRIDAPDDQKARLQNFLEAHTKGMRLSNPEVTWGDITNS